MSKPVICLLCGGQSTEHEVSLQSAKNVLAAIPRDKYDVLVVGIGKDGSWNWYEDGIFLVNADSPVDIALAPGALPVSPIRFNGRCVLIAFKGARQSQPFDIIFPVLHGINGEDGTIQGLAQMLGCPCVGCGMTASAICMDKAFAKMLLEHEGIRTARWLLLRRGEELPPVQQVTAKLGMPLFVKPANAGSSVGVVKVKTPEEFVPAVALAMKYDSRVLVEEAVSGREIECAVLGNTELFCAAPGEVVPKVDFYSYEAKYTLEDGADLITPAPLTPGQLAEVQTIAKAAYRALGCRGMARVDFFLRQDGTWLLNEINTIPGFTRISMFPKLMGLSGIPYSELVDKLIALATDNLTPKP